jgi:hypothetical protein
MLEPAQKAKIPVFTFVSDDVSYREMRASFATAGLTHNTSRFTRLTSRGGPGEPEPYSTITELISSVSEPYFILCHQDVRLDQEHGVSQLRAQIAELSVIDPTWAVAGDAGGSSALRMVRRITDPHGGSTVDSLPARVQTLDENFLVIRTGTGLTCSPGLTGFHFYGSDICLRARTAGLQCWVIDFHVQHLSGGKKGRGYDQSRDEFLAAWNQSFLARYVRAPTELLFLSKSPLLRAAFGSVRVRKILKNHADLGRIVGRVFARN